MGSGGRKSQQGMKRDRPNQIHLSLSLRDEVPLRSSKDAWKPARFNPDIKNLNKEEKKTEVSILFGLKLVIRRKNLCKGNFANEVGKENSEVPWPTKGPKTS